MGLVKTVGGALYTGLDKSCQTLFNSDLAAVIQKVKSAVYTLLLALGTFLCYAIWSTPMIIGATLSFFFKDGFDKAIDRIYRTWNKNNEPFTTTDCAIRGIIILGAVFAWSAVIFNASFVLGGYHCSWFQDYNTKGVQAQDNLLPA